MGSLLPILIGAVILCLAWFVVRFVKSQFRERAEDLPRRDPPSPVLAPKKNSPRGRAGAVALEEPDEDGDFTYPPRVE